MNDEQVSLGVPNLLSELLHTPSDLYRRSHEKLHVSPYSVLFLTIF